MVAQNGQKVFGAGRFYASPSTSLPTPTPFGVVQDMSVDFKRDIKRLHGLNQFPVDVASGMMTITGRVNHAVLNGRLFNDLMMGGSLTTGQVPWIANESQTIANTSLGAGSITSTNGATFQIDLGVYLVSNGVPFVRVSTAATPTTGQYTVQSTNGVYTFSSLETNVAVKLSYLYSTSGGQTVTMTNQPMGRTGAFQAVLEMLWTNLGGVQEKSALWLYSCIASDYNIATKLDDYMKPAFGFDAAADANDTLGVLSVAEVN